MSYQNVQNDVKKAFFVGYQSYQAIISSQNVPKHPNFASDFPLIPEYKPDRGQNLKKKKNDFLKKLGSQTLVGPRYDI